MVPFHYFVHKPLFRVATLKMADPTLFQKSLNSQIRPFDSKSRHSGRCFLQVRMARARRHLAAKREKEKRSPWRRFMKRRTICLFSTFLPFLFFSFLLLVVVVLLLIPNRHYFPPRSQNSYENVRASPQFFSNPKILKNLFNSFESLPLGKFCILKRFIGRVFIDFMKKWKKKSWKSKFSLWSTSPYVFPTSNELVISRAKK